MSLHFGDFTFDPGARELVRHGRRLELSPKACELLLALLEARPRALSRAEIHDRLWPRTFVTEASLRQVVVELRRVLEDGPREPVLVRTVRRFGYAFSGTVREDPPPGGNARRVSTFLLLRGTHEQPLYEGENLLGRESDAEVRLASDKASRRHARIVVEGSSALVEDLDSKNGTKVNGRRIRSAVALQAGDRIEVGRELLVFCRGPAAKTRTDLG